MPGGLWTSAGGRRRWRRQEGRKGLGLGKSVRRCQEGSGHLQEGGGDGGGRREGKDWAWASLSGDARRALDICRRAAEMAEAGGKERIGLSHVTAAYQEMFTSPKIQAIRSCSKYEQFVLQVLAGEFHRTGVEESSVGAVFRELSARLRTEAMPVLSLPGAVAACARLSAMRLILAEHFRNGLETKLRLNVAADDINFALKQEEEDS